MEKDPYPGPLDASSHYGDDHHFTSASPRTPASTALDSPTNAQHQSISQNSLFQTDPATSDPDLPSISTSISSSTTATSRHYDGHRQNSPTPTSNLQSAALPASSSSQISLLPTPIYADDLYKSSQSTDDATASSSMSPLMASTLDDDQSIIPNGNYSVITNHPAALVALPSRGPGPQQATRSVSGPTVRPKGGPSVKDLKRRFDNKGSPSTSSDDPSQSPQILPRQRRGPTNSPTAPPNGLAVSSTTPNSSDISNNQMPAMQKSLNNNRSFASRINNSTPAAAAAASSSHPHFAPHSPSHRRPGQAGLLFGEVDPESRDSARAGFGINENCSRPTSESNITTKSKSKAISDAEKRLDASSPPSVHSTTITRTIPPSASSSTNSQQSSRTRSQSDTSSLSSLARTPLALRNASRLSGSYSASKLPLAVRRLHSPASSSGDASPSRVASPANMRRPRSAADLPLKITPPPSRAKTPTSLNKTPTPAVRERRPPPPSLKNSANGFSRLRSQATSPPKLSPTPRNSLPTQLPMNKSRQVATSKPPRPKGKDPTPRQRKLSAGPIDFEKRRQHICNAYTKSIRESQVLQAKQKAVSEAKVNRNRHGGIPPVPQIPREALDKPNGDHASSSTAVPPEENKAAAVPTPLPIAATMISTLPATAEDSPTLGIPGSFPPSNPQMEQSAQCSSAESETTEFDGETQTILPVPAQQPPSVSVTVVKLPSPSPTVSNRSRTEYQYFFPDDLSDSRQRSFSLVSPHPANRQTDLATLVPGTDLVDESDCQSDMDGRQEQHTTYPRSEGATTDACTEDTDDRDRYERISGFRYDDALDSKRASTCASSDVSGYDDSQPSASERGSFSASVNLGVSSSRYRPDRASRQSARTDHSMDGSGLYGMAASGIFNSSNSANLSPTVSAMQKPRQESFPDSVSSVSIGTGKLHTTSPDNLQLPELDTGEGFSIPYISPDSCGSLSHLPSHPAHGPPPVPQSATGSALHSPSSSAVFEPFQSASTLINSERDSDACGAYTKAHQSGDTTSLETADNELTQKISSNSGDGKSLYHDSDAPSEKERHRLVQRRNVIKELVDTEAVFVRDMNIIEEIYKGTAEACPHLDDQTIKLIFRNSHEIIEFHTSFLAEIKSAVASVYVPKGGRTAKAPQLPTSVDSASGKPAEINDASDRETTIGSVFQRHLEHMKTVHEGFLRNSDQAAKKLIHIQRDPTVKVWLTECNEVAKDLTAAWDLDSLLIKPMQRITKYPNLIMTLLQHTPPDHPDRESLAAGKDSLESAIIEINKTKKNFELVGQIVGRKHKESDVKAGFARAFGKRVDKLQASSSRIPDDPVYTKLNEKFGDDFVQLQVVLRDVEFYTRQVSQYVHEFLQYLSSMELVMRLQPGNFPEIESKWVQFNISMRDMEKVALESHLAQVRKQVIEPFEQVIKAYGNPSLAMKKRQRRRLDYERADQQRRSGKSLDPKLRDLVEQYDALNDALKDELPKLSAMTEKVGKICLGNFVNIQTNWYRMWTEKMGMVLSDLKEIPMLDEVVATFQRDYPYTAELVASIGILNPDSMTRSSQSTEHRSRYSESERRRRGSAMNDESVPTLPAPEFGKRSSAGISLSPSVGSSMSNMAGFTNPHHYYYRDFYAGISNQGASIASPTSGEAGASLRSVAGSQTGPRPSTSKSFDSTTVRRRSSEVNCMQRSDSNVTCTSSHAGQETTRFSNLFHSALPLPDGTEESQRSSRASSRERGRGSDGYNVLWLAASLFEFNIETTKHEAGYPYLTYQAGEIFDIIAEKGELWLAKNQDDETEMVGWIWSKHFAKLADS